MSIEAAALSPFDRVVTRYGETAGRAMALAFVLERGKRVQAIESALLARSSERLGQSVHRLKGACLYFCDDSDPQSLSRRLGDVEELNRVAAFRKIDNSLPQIFQSLQEISDSLEARLLA